MRAKASLRHVAEAVEALLLQKQVNGCSSRTVAVYKWWLDRLAAVVPDTAALDSVALTRFFAGLRERGVSASTVHQAFRTLRTFTRWLIATEQDPQSYQCQPPRTLTDSAWRAQLRPAPVRRAIRRRETDPVVVNRSANVICWEM